MFDIKGQRSLPISLWAKVPSSDCKAFKTSSVMLFPPLPLTRGEGIVYQYQQSLHVLPFKIPPQIFTLPSETAARAWLFMRQGNAQQHNRSFLTGVTVLQGNAVLCALFCNSVEDLWLITWALWLLKIAKKKVNKRKHNREGIDYWFLGPRCRHCKAHINWKLLLNEKYLSITYNSRLNLSNFRQLQILTQLYIAYDSNLYKVCRIPEIW